MQADRLCNARRLYATERMVLIMKYLVLIPDGMADEPIAELGGNVTRRHRSERSRWYGPGIGYGKYGDTLV